MSKRMHLLNDDKYVDEFIENINKSKFYGEDIFCVITDAPLKYIKSTNIEIINPNNKGSSLPHINLIKNCDYLYIHYLDYEKAILANKVDKRIKIIWIFWGGDGYGLSRLKHFSFLKDDTKNLLRRLGLLQKKILFRRFKSVIQYLLPINSYERKFNHFLQRVDYCATWVKGDYDLIKKNYPFFKAKWIEFAYMNPLQITAEEELEKSYANTIEKPYIVVGNSANPTNNHLEILNHLKNHNWKGRIVCPLSYAGSPIYVNKIIEIGKSLFADNFIPITEYLNKASYTYILKNASTLVINHLRQQAGANLMIAIRFEVPVVALSNNTLMQTFIRWELGIANNVNNLNQIDLKKNKDILEERMSDSNILKMYKNLCFQNDTQ